MRVMPEGIFFSTIFRIVRDYTGSRTFGKFQELPVLRLA
jgi:hypothetical protein